MADFTYLFSPLKIGPITVPNRIAMPPMATGIVDHPDGGTGILVHGEKYAYFLAERAKGGAGLIVYGEVKIHPTTAWEAPNVTAAAYDERVIPGFKKATQLAHGHGAKIFCELAHSGVFQVTGGLHSKLPLWGPSAVPVIGAPEMPKEMEIEDIEELIQFYGKSAQNAREGDFDGILIHSTHGYLIHQFLSPLFNKRNDQYGGPLENRMRFLLRVVDKVRETIGKNMALGVRIPGDELLAGGLNPDNMKEIARRLEGTGKVDFLDITLGPFHVLPFAIGSMYVPPGNMVPYAAGIREVVSIPVFAAGRILDPVQAETILAEGKADMIDMGRALLADPELPNKARGGKLEDIRPCTGCCQNCVGKIEVLLPADCAQNPCVGREREWGIDTIQRLPKGKRVMVIGGGPAGLEAALVAALRGHNVTLIEKGKELGGQALLGQKLPGREEMEGFVRWRKIQLEKLKVKVLLGQEATVESVEALKPDAVVVATGSTALATGINGLTMSPVPGWQQKNVFTTDQILREETQVGDNVLIFDAEGNVKGPGIAEMLAVQGKKVEILTTGFFVGMNINGMNRVPIYMRMGKVGVKLTPQTSIKQISGRSVTVFHVVTSEERTIENVDSVILITGREANDSLYRQLKGKVRELYRIGDCVAQRPIDRAIYDGHRIGRLL